MISVLSSAVIHYPLQAYKESKVMCPPSVIAICSPPVLACVTWLSHCKEIQTTVSSFSMMYKHKKNLPNKIADWEHMLS